MLYNRNISVYHLLGNKILIKLSYNQIINCADYFIFDNGLHYILLEQLRKSIEKESYFADFFNQKKSYQSNFKTLIIIKQITANILDKFFKDSFLSYPFNFQLLKSNIKIQQKLDKSLASSNFCLQLTNFKIINEVGLKYVLKIIGGTILDKKFYIFISKLFTNIINVKDIFIDRSSKFFKIVCNIYLLQLDKYVIKYFKENNYIFKKIENSILFKTENLVFKALAVIKTHLYNIQHLKAFFLKQKRLNANIIHYIRYFDQIFFSVDKLFDTLNRFKKTLIFFCKSILFLNFKIIGWSYIKKAIIKFCGIYYIVNGVSLNNVCIQTFVYIKSIKMQFLNFEIINQIGKPVAISYLLILYNGMIVNWFNYLLLSLKKYYIKTSNYKKLYNVIFYFLKWSLLNTLQKKHKKSFSKVVLNYYKTAVILKQLYSHVNLSYVYRYRL